MSIPYQKNLSAMILHQAMQKLAYLIRGDRALNKHKFHMTAPTDCCNHIQSKACSCSFYDRCAPFERPCFSRVEIRPDTRFVFKIDYGPFFFSSFLNLWVYFGFPFIHQFRVLLVSTIQRLLTSKPKLTQQSPYRGFTEIDSELFLNQACNQPTGPKGKRKLES